MSPEAGAEVCDLGGGAPWTGDSVTSPQPPAAAAAASHQAADPWHREPWSQPGLSPPPSPTPPSVRGSDKLATEVGVELGTKVHPKVRNHEEGPY